MKRSLFLLSAVLAGHIAFAGPPMFPEPTPIPDANPNVREEATVQMPSKLQIERTKNTLSIALDDKSLGPETIKAGAKMIIGVETRLYVYPEGGKRSAEPSRIGLSGGSSPTVLANGAFRFTGAGTSILNTSQGGIPQPGTKYVVELEMNLFETNTPAQHMWSPYGPMYKVLWTKTLKQTVE